MTLTQFIRNNIGKKIDFDGAHGFQCVDLYRQYVKDVLKLPQSPGVDGAKLAFRSRENLLGCLYKLN